MRSLFSPISRIPLAFCALPAFLLSGAPAKAQSPYQQPGARVVRNPDGSRLNIRVDPNNQIVEETMEDAGKAVLWRIVKELDDALLPKKATKYDGRNRVISNHRYTYLRGRLEEEEIYDASNNLLSKLVFYYDSKNRMNKVEQLNARGQVVSVSRATGPGTSPSSTASRAPQGGTNQPSK